MKYNEIYDALIDLDKELFDKWNNATLNSTEKIELEKAHEAIKTAILAFTNAMENTK